MATKIDTFLEHATTGLAADPELRLDVQAELRSHLEDRLEELGGEEHTDEALTSLGEVVELAEEVSEANQRRLGWRNVARRILRFGLVPASIICAFLFSDFTLAIGMRQLAMLGGTTNGNATSRLFAWLTHRQLNRSEHSSLVLNGDPTRTGADRFRTLWERNPTNRVYYADYITHAMPSPHPSYAAMDDPFTKRFLAELEHAPTVDPNNGRYPLLSAVIRATGAAELVDPEPVAGQDRPKVYSLKPVDRPALDKAMADLLAASAMPELRCYHWEILQERVDVLGSPERLLDIIERVAVSASALLPDLAWVRSAGRYSMAYADLLVAEGRAEEAIPFLHVAENLGRTTAKESFCLIELLVSAALTGMAGEIVPGRLRELGREADAAVAERRLTAVGKPMQEWRAQRDVRNPELDRLVTERAGILSGMLLPSLGWQDTTGLAEKLENNRRLEFTVMTQAIISLLGLLLLVAMLVCLGVALRWRFSLGSQAAPLLLLPSWRDMARFVLLGVLVPFAVFLLWTRLVPFSGHAYGLKVAWHRTLTELLALSAALLLVPASLAVRSFRRRCLELDLAAPTRLPKALRWLLIVAGVLLLAGFMVPLRTTSVQTGALLALAGGALLVLVVFCITILSLFASQQSGRAIGTLSRSLIPVLASATLILSVLAQPILRAQERRLLRADEILWTGDEPGFSRIESDLTKRLREATLKAMAENP